MLNSIPEKITSVLVENEIIESDDFEIYRYGFEALIYFIVNISVALLIGIIFDKVIHTIVFLSCYCTLRQFTGGYHARNYTECTLTFVVIYLITIFIDNNIDVDQYKYILILFLILSIIIIYKLSPMEHRNKPLSSSEKKHYRMVAMNIVVAASLVFILSIWLDIFKSYAIYILFAIVWICILLILGFCINLDR